MRCNSQRAAATPTVTQALTFRSDPYTPHLPKRADDYHRASRVLLFIGIGWHILGLALFLRLGLSARTRDFADFVFLRLRRGSVEDQPSGEPPVHDRATRSSDRLDHMGSLSRKPAGFGAHLEGRQSDLRRPGFISVTIFYLFYSVCSKIWSLPIGLAGYAIERRFGFSNESLLLFLKDHLIGLCTSWVMIPVIWIGYVIYARWPKRWWLVLWAVMAPTTLFVTVVYPLVVAPLYNRYTPMEPGSLRSDILALAERAGIHGGNVLVEDTSRRTSHVNAYVEGIGPSTRIVLNDTALQTLPRDQILAMMGHEMGHYAEHHVLVSAAAGIIGTGLILGVLAILLPRLANRFGRAFRLRGLSDLAVLPLLLLTVYLLGLLGEPVSTALSRTLEKRADVYGLRMTGLNDATAKLMVGFAERDLSDPNPPWLLHLWFGTHPTLSDRIEFARRFRR